ncbi:MAG: hypothetical protein P4M04_16610 [Acidobacteriota bacterium]|nr:hypothetical protein [Acidobacteriota bacterium]
MLATFRFAATVVVLAGLALAATGPDPGLKTRADAAKGGEKAKLCLEYAHQQLLQADTLFNHGEVDKGMADISEVVEYSRKAADAAASSGKHQKQTEIELRKLSKRMHDIGETLAFEDRAPVRKAVEEIEQIRSDLLGKMFGLKPEGKS